MIQIILISIALICLIISGYYSMKSERLLNAAKQQLKQAPEEQTKSDKGYTPRYPKTREYAAELECTFMYKPNCNVTKWYSLFDLKVKSELHECYTQFDNKAKLFSLQCSKDSESWDKVQPYIEENEKKIFTGEDAVEFPMTLRQCMILASWYAGAAMKKWPTYAQYKFWRVGIDYSDSGAFLTCFSGDMLSPVFDPNNEMELSKSVFCHLE